MESDYNRYRKVDVDKEIRDWLRSDELSNKEKRQFEKECTEDEKLESDFWVFWEEIRAFAAQYRLSTSYVEEEFILDGELIPVHLAFEDDVTPG